MAAKYIIEVTKGYETTIEFSAIEPISGEEIKHSAYSVPWTVKPGRYVYKTVAKAKAAIAEHQRNGGEAHLVRL